jgi:hypothetical protein
MALTAATVLTFTIAVAGLGWERRGITFGRGR